MNVLRSLRWLGPLTALALPALAAEKAAPLPAAPAKSGSAPGGAPRFQQVRDRAAALYRHRNQPPPAPTAEENPFRPPGARTISPDAGPEPGRIATPMPGELSVLQQAVAALRVSGTFEKDGDTYLVINAKPYRVGDIVQARVQGEIVYLRIREIERNSVTLALNETEMTLKHNLRVQR